MIRSASARDEGPPSDWSQEQVDEAATARVVVDGHGVVTAWNEGARRLLGYRASEVVGRNGSVLLADAAHTHVLDSLTGLPRWSGTATLLHRDGHRLTVGLLAHHRENDGDDDWLLVSAVSKPAPTPEDDSFVRRSFAQAPYTMALYDTGLRLRWANADMERVMGLSEKEMRGLRVTEIVLDPESERTEEGMRTALETGRLQELGAALHLAGHERESVWSVSLVPVRNSDGRSEGVLLSAHDVTEQYLARQRLVLVNDASVRIGSTLDLPRTAQELADVAVPRFADFVTVDLLPAIEGGEDPPQGAPSGPVMLRRVASQSVLEGCPETVVPHGTVAAYPEGSTAADCLASGRPLIEHVTPAVLENLDRTAPQRADRMRQFGFHSVLAVPMRARGLTLGVATFSRHRHPKRFEQDDLLLGQEITARAAVCIDNARRYTRERDTSLTLQSSLLPQRLPEQAALDVASRYLPASAQAGVGGDWFDVIPLSGARVALVVGDVVGHGIQASATMGRLRTAVRTLADVDLPPDELLTHLDDLVNHLAGGEDSMALLDGDIGATCLYAVYDPVSRRCTIARAGHPVPALVAPDGTVEFLEVPAGPPLGLGGLPFESTELELTEGSLLVLFTDGLVEARGRDIDEGIDAMREVLRRPAQGLEAICDALLRTMLVDRPSDDVALLVARTRALDASRVATWQLPPDPAAVAGARKAASRQLSEWGLDDAVFVTELVVSELVTNAIRYGRPPIELRLIYDRTLICEVSDGSATAPHLRRARTFDEGGRGLLLVAQLTQGWGTRHITNGKIIWAEQSLPVD
ncbi:SpoIIE family protein phosphatase [Streptomyces resistomycificus]|uniref:PAS/PAC sensor protein n=1 Tax=Streptomyces resistomycificus TaxID=67356 RepID=A0A0L8LGI7_9ACTN|nr:SpoIIE family protein phosphatase [Streptomyces resistomycificus]KOG37242.1 PAS/PAC sensor protein [Streptomyces resistomycificus]KUN95201.1 PAS sensor protein [Streptomyces resistomycificus]